MTCKEEDIQRLLPHIPLEYREYLDKNQCQIEAKDGYGTGCYQGYDVKLVYYTFGDPTTGGRIKVFPFLINTYSQKLGTLVQVSVIIHHNWK